MWSLVVRDESNIQLLRCTINVSRVFWISNTTLCDRVSQWLAAGRWLSPGTSALNTINPCYGKKLLVYFLRMEFSILCLLTNEPCGVTFRQIMCTLQKSVRKMHRFVSRRCPFHAHSRRWSQASLRYSLFQLLFFGKLLGFL
jgi:hypothetical protein